MSGYEVAKKICSCTNFTICTVLNCLMTIKMHTPVIENHATAYPTVQLRTSTFWQEKAIKNHIMTSAYHQWHHVITSCCPYILVYKVVYTYILWETLLSILHIQLLFQHKLIQRTRLLPDAIF